MKVTLESTDKIVDLNMDGQMVSVRLWMGKTENGVPCYAFIGRIAVHKSNDSTEFTQDLQKCQPNSSIASLIQSERNPQ